MHKIKLGTECNHRVLTITEATVEMFWQIWPEDALIDICLIVISRRDSLRKLDIPITSKNERLYRIL